MALVIDFSKGSAIHRLYGHHTFVEEALRANRNSLFISNICRAVKCNGNTVTWRNRL